MYSWEDVYSSVLLSVSSLSTPSLFLVDQSGVLRRVLSDETERTLGVETCIFNMGLFLI